MIILAAFLAGISEAGDNSGRRRGTMKTLLALRHGKSSWKQPGLADHDRPLNRRGRRDAPWAGRLLRSEGLAPDQIVSSTAVRARTTAELAAAEAGCGRPVLRDRRLYLAGAAEIIRVLGEVGGDASRLLLVGHNPGLEALTACLTRQVVALPTAALVEIRLELAAWSKLEARTPGRLVKLWRPPRPADA